MFRRKANAIWVTVVSIVAVTFVAAFLAGDLLRVKSADAAVAELPAPNKMLSHSKDYSAPMLKAIKIDPKNPLHLEFVIDSANKAEVTQEDASVLIRYFLAGLTVPSENLWVNLSPYEKDRVISEDLGETDLGNQMLAQDYILKQMSASFTAPTDRVGKAYWKDLNERVAQISGTAATQVDTFNKIWIVPQKATVYENNNIAAIADSGLDVMLEHDYLAASKQGAKGETSDAVADAAKEALRERVIPVITEEVNRGAHFATLRQMFSALILAKWFKAKLQNSFYQVYFNQSKMSGVDTMQPKDNKVVFDRYVQAFQKGCYDYLKKDVDPATGKTFARRYFSGGVAASSLTLVVEQQSVKPVLESSTKPLTVSFDLNPQSNAVITSVGLPAVEIVEGELLNAIGPVLSGKVEAVCDDMRMIYDTMGLMDKNYHNHLHNLAVPYFAAQLAHPKTAQKKTVLAIAGLLHDFDIRPASKLNDRGVARGVAPTVRNTIDVLRNMQKLSDADFQDYAGSLVEKMTVSRDEKQATIKAIVSLRANLDDLIEKGRGNLSREEMYIIVRAIIRRSDFPSDVVKPNAASEAFRKFSGAPTSARAEIQKAVGNKTALQKAIHDAKKARNDILAEVGAESVEGVYFARTMNIEIDNAEALLEVPSHARVWVNDMGLDLEMADQMSFYVLSSTEAVKQVVEGLSGEQDFISVEGTYPGFFKQFLLRDAAAAEKLGKKFKSLSAVKKENFIKNIEFFVAAAASMNGPFFAGAQDHWDGIKPVLENAMGMNPNKTVALSNTNRGITIRGAAPDPKKVGGIDLKNLSVDGVTGASPIVIANVDINPANFGGFDFQVTALEKYPTAQAMLASFI